MKTCLHYLFTALLIVSLGSCKKDKTSSYTITGDYLIAGRAMSFTIAGAKTNYYIVSGSELRKDSTQLNQAPPTDIGQFRFTVLMPAANYATVADLQTSIPAELLSRNNQHIGTQLPDAGYMDVRTVSGGVAYHWYIENDQTGSSAAVQTFASRLTSNFQ